MIASPARIFRGGREPWRHDGLTLTSPANGEGVGLCVHPVRGRGTGKASFANLQVEGFKTGVLIDSSRFSGNGDVLDFGGLFKPMHCDVGFRATTQMNMGHRFGVVWPYGTRQVFDYLGGGDLNVESLIATYRTQSLLEVHHSGSNNGRYRIGSIKQDSQVSGCRWIKHHSPNAARFVVGQADIGGSHRRGETLIDLWGPQTLHASHVHQLAAENIVLRDKRRRGRSADLPTVTLTGCVLADEPDQIVLGRGRLKLIGCTRPDGSFFDDWQGEVTR